MTTNCVKPLHQVINKKGMHQKKINGNKYLTLVPIDKNNNTLKEYRKP